MTQPRVPISRIGKFFGVEDYDLDISMGEEWLHGDMNFTLVLYRVNRIQTKTDDVYGETIINDFRSTKSKTIAKTNKFQQAWQQRSQSR